jgi:hypothetical protein
MTAIGDVVERNAQHVRDKLCGIDVQPGPHEKGVTAIAEGGVEDAGLIVSQENAHAP